MRLTRVTEVVEVDMDALVYLDIHRFIPGCEATVTGKGPDGTVVLEVAEGTVALGSALANQLYVTPVRRRAGLAQRDSWRRRQVPCGHAA